MAVSTVLATKASFFCSDLLCVVSIGSLWFYWQFRGCCPIIAVNRQTHECYIVESANMVKEFLSCPIQDVLMVYTTFPDEQSAKRIARELVKLKLAACANIFGGMTSIYEWKGEVMEEGEVGVLFKTVRSRFVELSKRALCAPPL